MSEGTRGSRRGFGANKLKNVNDRTLRVEDSTLVIAFLEEENFTFAGRHWIDFYDQEQGRTRKTVKNCLSVLEEGDEGFDDRGCPLCDAGDQAKPTYYFNVVNLANPSKVLVWEASTDPANKIEKRYVARAQNGQHINDPDIYWAVSKEQNGKNGKGAWTYSVDPVKSRDLEEDWPSLKVLTDERRVSLLEKLYDETYVKYESYEALESFVDSIV